MLVGWSWAHKVFCSKFTKWKVLMEETKAGRWGILFVMFDYLIMPSRCGYHIRLYYNLPIINHPLWVLGGLGLFLFWQIICIQTDYRSLGDVHRWKLSILEHCICTSYSSKKLNFKRGFLIEIGHNCWLVVK